MALLFHCYFRYSASWCIEHFVHVKAMKKVLLQIVVFEHFLDCVTLYDQIEFFILFIMVLRFQNMQIIYNGFSQ